MEKLPIYIKGDQGAAEVKISGPKDYYKAFVNYLANEGVIKERENHYEIEIFKKVNPMLN